MHLSLDVCVMCMRASESHEHLLILFMHCLMARIWCKLFGVRGEPRSVEELIMISHVCFGRSRDASLLWNCSIFGLLWDIWIERNSRIFKNRELSLSFLWEKIIV